MCHVAFLIWAGPVDSCVHGLVSTFIAAPRQTHRLVQRLESESLVFAQVPGMMLVVGKSPNMLWCQWFNILKTHNEQLNNVLNIRKVVVFFTDWVVRCLSNLQSFWPLKRHANLRQQLAVIAATATETLPWPGFLTNRYFERWRKGNLWTNS